MTTIAHVKKSRKGKAILYIVIHIMLTLIIMATFVFLSVDSFFDLGFLNLVAFPFFATVPIFGIPLNILVIAMYLLSFIMIWVFIGSPLEIEFIFQGNDLTKTLNSKLNSLSKTYDINEFDYYTLTSKTVISASTSTNSSGGTSTSVASSTTHYLKATKKGASVDEVVLYTGSSESEVRNVAEKISKATKIEIR